MRGACAIRSFVARKLSLAEEVEGRPSELLDADINGHQFRSSALLDPVAGMCVADDLTGLFLYVVLRLALVCVFRPTAIFHIDADLFCRRMAAFNVLH